LRNLNITGIDTGLVGINISGNATNSGNSKVYVEDCLVDGFFGGNANGIRDARAGTCLLGVSNTTVRNMGGAGIIVIPAAAGNTNFVTISNSRVMLCGSFGYGATNGAKATIFNSVFLRNGVGIHVDANATEANVDQCVVQSSLANGFEATSAGSTIRVSNTTAINNNPLATATGGQVNSYGNNMTGGAGFPGTVGQT